MVDREASPLIMGFTSVNGKEECAISLAVLILCEPVSSCLTDVKTRIDASALSISSSFTTTESGLGAECWATSLALWLRLVCCFPTYWLTELSCQVSAVGDVFGRFWKMWHTTELLHFWPFSMGVLHFTAEAGVFGEIGGESKVAFDNCCLEKDKRKSVYEWQHVRHLT